MNKIYTTRRAIVDNTEITSIDQIVENILNCNEQEIAHFQLRRGDVVTIETVTVSLEIAMEKEHRYGFDGMLRERVTNKVEVVDATETHKLWKTSKRGWYWK